jgi:NADH-quinone oxidoreductase subunit G
MAAQHPQASLLRAAMRFTAKAAHAAFNEIPSGANDVGLARAGAQPKGQGKHAAAMLAQPPKHLIVYQAGSQDTSSSAAFDAARSQAEFCVYIGAYACNGVRRTAHAVLPIGLPPEAEGSYVNVDGIVQTLAAGAKAPGDARAGWKVLRALGAALGVAGFEFTSFDQVRDLIASRLSANAAAPHPDNLASRPAATSGLARIATVPIYRADQVLRRCPALQSHPLTGKACVALNPQDALAQGLSQDATAKISADGVEIELPVSITTAVPVGAAWIESTWPATRALPPMGASLTVTRA